MNPRLERVKTILICPSCGGDLAFDQAAANCRDCSEVFPIRGGKIYFKQAPASADDLDEVKGRLKKLLGNYYYTIGRDIIAPTYPFNFSKHLLRRLNPAEQIVIDAGCGNHRLDEHVIGMDFFDYEAVDIVCNLDALPFKDNSVDAFVSRGVLEHLPYPARAVNNFHQCTRPDGLGMHLVPFLFPFHASPHDFQRYTHKGLEVLFERWEIVEQFNATGPVTLGLVNTIEFMSIVFSLGWPPAKAYLYLGLCVLLFPLKFLDAPFINRKSFLTLAPTIFTVLRKHG